MKRIKWTGGPQDWHGTEILTGAKISVPVEVAEKWISQGLAEAVPDAVQKEANAGTPETGGKSRGKKKEG